VLLAKRGMEIPDHAAAEHSLSHISYYRLRSYWQSFEADPVSHRFEPGTNFAKVLAAYIFDRELRLILLDAIERIEISARTRWMQAMIQAYGSHPHLNGALFPTVGKSRWDHTKAVEDLEKSFNHSKEAFAIHFKEKYAEKLPPLWAMCELMTFGEFSKWYANTGDRKIKKKAAQYYDLDEKIFQSLLHQISYIRNFCAHHAHLWDRHLTITCVLPKQTPESVAKTLNRHQKNKLYNSIVMMKHLMDIINPDSLWHDRLITLITNSDIDQKRMGFPDDELLR